MDQRWLHNHIINENEHQLRALLNELSDFICFKDGEGRWLQTNHFSLRLFQLEQVPYLGKTDIELAAYSPFFTDVLLHCYHSDQRTWQSGISERYDEKVPQPDGSEKVFDVIKVPLYHADGARKGLIVIGRDITQCYIAQEHIKHMAYHDELTGLPNKRQLYEILSNEMEKSRQSAVMFIDLDRFKVINDSLGHFWGDLLLQKVSERLVQCIPKGIVSRQAGDEFIILIPDTCREESEHIAQEVLRQFDMPFAIDTHEIFISPSIGICLSNESDTAASAQEIIRLADIAMYQAKREGRNTYRFYSNTNNKIYNSLEMEINLHKALERNEFFLLYQPQMDLQTGKITGIEALIRWNHPYLGIVSPSDFIPLAEETGLIVPIGQWVLYEASKQSKAWQEKGHPPITVAVNLSARQFYQHDLVQMVSQALRETKLEPRYLELEITESITMDVGRTIATLHELKKLGIQISIDDFGIGYSSLAYLKTLPVDKLKIDQSFVLDCLKESSDATIVQTIIAMAKNLNLRVIAEGVESKEHFLFLQKYLCHDGQGYFISKPVSLEQLEETFSQVERLIEEHGITQTLNKHMWMEEELKKTRQDLQDAIHFQQGMTFKFKEQDGRFIHTIGDGELLYRIGLSPEQLIGKELFDVLPPDQAHRKVGFYKKAWAGSKVNFEGERNGIFYLAALSPIIRGGQVIEVVASCVDITERKQMEEELKESEERYRQLVEIAPDAIVVHNNGEILYINQAGLKLIEADSAKEIIGRFVYDFILPDSHEIAKKRIKHVQEEKKSIDLFENTIIGLQGRRSSVQITATHIFYKGSAATQIILRDVTERAQQAVK